MAILTDLKKNRTERNDIDKNIELYFIPLDCN